MRPQLRFSANISFMFTERPFLERFGAAAAAGFEAVECHFPYDHTLDDLRHALRESGLELNGLNTAPGDVGAGEWGRAALPGREADFAADFEQALHYAHALGASTIHVMSGVVEAASRPQALDTFAGNLRRVAPVADRQGLTLLIEPLNTRDKTAYLFSRSDDVAAFIERLSAPNVRLLFDIYHVQVMEGDLTTRLRRHFPLIGHVQIAAVPSRAEPDRGEVHYPALLAELAGLGYAGWIGCEYRPAGRTEDGLGWMGRRAGGAIQS